MYALVGAMERLAVELGVKFRLNSPVERVVVTKGRASGVRVGGEEISADAVLANADLPYAYRELLGGEADSDFKLRKREKLQYTASAFMLYLGVDGDLENMLHHNFYLSPEYRENFEAIFRDGRLPEDPSFYAVVPSRPSLPWRRRASRPSSSSCRCRTSGRTWTGSGKAPRSRRRSTGLLERRCGLDRSKVVYEKVKTPYDWRDDYNLEEGAAFGIGHGILQVGYFRPPMVSRSIEGMYFVGASTRRGRACRSSP
jgi:phytoene desaturase